MEDRNSKMTLFYTRGWKPDLLLGLKPRVEPDFWVESGWTPAVEKRVQTGWVEPTDPKNGLKRVEFLVIKVRVELSFNFLHLIEPEYQIQL